jgi:hypothetical protein
MQKIFLSALVICYGITGLAQVTWANDVADMLIALLVTEMEVSLHFL